MATAVTPSAPPARTYTSCSPAEWDSWYCEVQRLDANMGLLSTIGQELRAHKVAFAEHWGETLNALQLGRLRNQLREADVSLDDISTAEDRYKDKRDEWWYAEGSKYFDRLLHKFAPRKREFLSKEMMDGTVLSPSECAEVVADPRFEQFEAQLALGDFRKAAALVSPDTVFGKRITRV